MAHEIKDGKFKISDFANQRILIKNSIRRDGELFVETDITGSYLTKADTEALIQYLQSKLPELK